MITLIGVSQIAFGALGGTAACLGILRFFGRGIVNHWLEKDLSRYREQLKRESDTELESLKHALRMASDEHSILLTRLQERRAKIIGELYERLVNTEYAIRVYATVGDDEKENRFKEAWNTQFDTLQFVDRKAVWLPKTCCDKIATFTQILRASLSQMHVHRSSMQFSFQQQHDWLVAWQEIEAAIPSALGVLAEELRGLIDPRAS